jgi:hypothetical protein
MVSFMRGALKSCIHEDHGGLADQVFPFFLGPQLAYLFGLGQREAFLATERFLISITKISACQVWVGEDHGLHPALLKEPLNRAIAIYPGLFLHAHGAQCT